MMKILTINLVLLSPLFDYRFSDLITCFMQQVRLYFYQHRLHLSGSSTAITSHQVMFMHPELRESTGEVITLAFALFLDFWD